MDATKLKTALLARCPALELREGEALSRHTAFAIGGPAALLALPKTMQELTDCLAVCRQAGERPVILGAGTNVLAPDEGLPRLVVKTRGLEQITLTDRGTILADCGATLARLARFALEQGLTGLEFAQGIPGTVGGGLVMNAGAYGGELCQSAVRTRVLEPDGTVTDYEGEAQGFGYRRSAFQGRDCVILQGEFALTPGDPAQIRSTMEELAARRRASQPLELPSAGSTFKRPATGYAAALIQQAGLKGLTVGGAQVSEKHAGFVVNVGGATAADVRELMRQVQAAVKQQFDVMLEPEVRLL